MTRTAVLLAALALAVPALTSAAPRAPAPETPVTVAWGPSSEILYATLGGSIYVVSPEGGSRRLLTSVSGDLGPLSLSPDGTTLLVGADFDLYTIPIAGGTRHRLGEGFGGLWEPHGTRVAFGTASGFSVVDADGRHRRQVATSRYTDVFPSVTWSPDGRKLAYARCSFPYGSRPCEHSYGFDIYVTGLDGSGTHRVTRKSGAPQCPAWSSVAKLAFEDGNTSMVLKGGGLRTYPGLGGCPFWAPDGRRLAVPTPTGIALATPDGTGVTRVRVPGVESSYFGIEWSPDSRRLPFISDRHLWVVSADGTSLERIRIPGFERATSYADFAWSPDGKRLTVVGGGHVWVVGADGSGRVRLA